MDNDGHLGSFNLLIAACQEFVEEFFLALFSHTSKYNKGVDRVKEFVITRSYPHL